MKSLTLLALSVTALAGEKVVITPEPATVPPWSLKLDGAWVGEGNLDKGGSTAVAESRIQLALQRPVGLPTLGGEGGHWVLRLGADWERFGFAHSGAPKFLPGTLQSVAAVVGLEYRTRAGLGAIFEARPGVFFEHHVTADSFDVPVKAAVVIPMGDRFAAVVGATYNGNRKNPIMPAAGFWWKITDSLILNAIPPEPRFELKVSDTALVWLGGEIAGGSFRTDAGRSGKLNEAVVSYSDYRASTGVAWNFADGWKVEAGGGVSFRRKFDYHRAEVGVKTDDIAPFVKLSLRGEW